MKRCVLVLVCLAGCGGDDGPGDAATDPTADSPRDVTASGPVMAKLSFESEAEFFDAPFPILSRTRDDGSLRVADFPSRGNALMEQLELLLEQGSEGVATNGAIFIPFDGPLEAASLPSIRESTREESPVSLVQLDGDARGRRIPVELAIASGDTYTADDVLVALPFPGAVLSPQSLHALIVLDDVRSERGVARSPQIVALSEDRTPEGATPQMTSAFQQMFEWLDSQSVARDRVVAATVFRTGDPFSRLRGAQEVAAESRPAVSNYRLDDDLDDYCVIAADLEMPVYQHGEPPYSEPPAGRLAFDAEGRLELQRTERIDLVLTIPKTPMPAAGYPLVLYAAGSGGVARQVIDRTRMDAGPSRGEGPARAYAPHGIAVSGFAAPLSGDRSPDESDGTLHFWNFGNLGAFRGNLEQAALDVTSVINAVEGVVVPAGLCPGSPAVRYDPDHIYLQGHSTGGTVASVAVALEPRVQAAVISGSGGSWIYNVAQSTIELGEGVLLRLGVFAATQLGRVADDPTRFDIDLTFFQTMLASTEVMSWGRVTALDAATPKDVLFIGGVIDTYHEPRLINSQGMSLGATMALPAAEPTWESEFELVGLGGSNPPIRQNVGDNTVVMIQREETRPGVNGHFVPFEHDDVKRRFACFIATHVRDGHGTVFRADVSSDCD